MGWQDLLAKADLRVLPWTGTRKLQDRNRAWVIIGPLPHEHGWYRFDVDSARKAVLQESAGPDPDFELERRLVKGYLAGNRLVADDARVVTDPQLLASQTQEVFLAEEGLDRIVRVACARSGPGTPLVYIRQEFPEGPELEVIQAWQDHKESVTDISGVTPALDMAFRWASFERTEAERREREREQRRIEAERQARAEELLHQAQRDGRSAVGRRVLAQRDFAAAARAALALSGAELLDTRSITRGERIVQYRMAGRRLECVVDARTLQVIDSGVCLTDESTGVRGDTWLSLESLPPTIAAAIDADRLVVYRHA